ncbi:MAG: hypothetical protein E6713_00530 [Sporomusaceae bacterium]|nr:hypothetical protein [Sporomusaceae bacterium]
MKPSKKMSFSKQILFIFLISFALGMSGLSQSHAVASEKKLLIHFSDPVILIEVANSSGDELPINYDKVPSSKNPGYHDFGSSPGDTVRVYAENGIFKIGSPSEPQNTVPLTMSSLNHIYALSSNNDLRIYVITGFDASNTILSNMAIAVIAKTKEGRFITLADQDNWNKFYPQDQIPLQTFYQELRRKNSNAKITERAPHSPLNAVYSVATDSDKIYILGTLKAYFSTVQTMGQWVYVLKWNNTTTTFDISYLQLK